MYIASMQVELENINPTRIAFANSKEILEVIRKSELLVNTQVENIRAIDRRAMQLLSSAGLTLSISTAIIVQLKTNDSLSNIVPTYFMQVGAIIAACSIVVCLINCLRIIQSEEINPTGNDGKALLLDISNQFSLHEQQVDYVLTLSECRESNELLIKKNGKMLKYSSIFFAIFVGIILALLLFFVFN